MKAQAYLRCCKNKKTSDIFLYKKKPKGENNFGIKNYKKKIIQKKRIKI